MEARRVLRRHRSAAEGAGLTTRRAAIGGVALLTAWSLIAATAHAPASGAGALETEPLEAFDASRGAPRPCAPVELGGRFVAGGCRAVATAFETPLSIRTPFGKTSFGDCTTTLDVTIGRDARIWLDNIRIGGPSPCNDIRPCAPPAVLARMDDPYDDLPLAKAYPWRGRLTSAAGDAAFRGEVVVCFDTCVGRYEGPVEIRIERKAAGWRMRADDAGVGDGGLTIDGDWSLGPAKLELRSRD